jgi:hypothetical protein
MKGVSWEKIFTTSQLFAIGDRGSVIVFANNIGTTHSFSFTLNEGFFF